VAKSTGAASASFAPVSPKSVSPRDGVSGPQLNPRFQWQGSGNESVSVVLQSNGSPVLRLQSNGYVDLTNGGSQLLPLRGVASFSVTSAGVGTAQLSRPLPPGRYSWRVRATAPDGSTAQTAARSFTVLGPRLTGLTVHAQRHAGTTSRYPGYTNLAIKTTPYARVTIRFTHQGRTGTVVQDWGSNTAGQFLIKWTCAHPGGVYSYTVAAADAEGDHRSVSGSFVSMSVARCTAMKAAERAAALAAAQAKRRAAQAAARAQLRAEQEAERQAQEQQTLAYERFVGNCEALGGTPVSLDVEGTSQAYCRAPYGGYLNVPY
jgi:hypothetical protein